MSRRILSVLGISVLATTLTSVSTQAGVAGNALHLDGSDTVKIPHSVDFDYLHDITVEMWVKYDSPNVAYLLDQFGGWPPEKGEWTIRTPFPETSGVEFYYRNPEIRNVIGGTLVADGNWHQVAVVVQTGRASIYVDGALDAMTDFGYPNILTGNLPIYLGSRGNFEAFLTGWMDEVRFWNVARTPQEIAANWNRTVDPATPGLLAYWNFNESPSDQNVLDVSGKGHRPMIC